MLLIFAGASVGGACRYSIGILIHRRLRGDFPLGTMVVNGSGAFFIGMAWALLEQYDPFFQGAIYPLFIAGFLGAYTTVSSYALDSLHLLHRKKWLPAFLYFFGTFLLCLAAVFLGLHSISLVHLFTH